MIEKFNKSNILNMEPMHDSIASSIKIEKNVLIIEYNNLKEVMNNDGPYYKYDNVIIQYTFDTFCDAKLFGKKIHLCDISEIIENYPNYKYESFKYSYDSLEELTLYMSVRQYKNNKTIKTKWNYIEISMDIVSVEYEWFDND